MVAGVVGVVGGAVVLAPVVGPPADELALEPVPVEGGADPLAEPPFPTQLVSAEKRIRIWCGR